MPDHPAGQVMHTAALLLGILAAASGAVGVRRAARGLPVAMGARRADLRAAAEASQHGRDGLFVNDEPARPVDRRVVAAALLRRGTAGRPRGPIPLGTAAPPSVSGALAATWFGHSTVLLEIDGHRVLTDPMWSDRASPSPTIGPHRLHPAPLPLSELPDVDAVLISHDHYDHLDLATVRTIASSMSAPFIVPVGIGAHLRFWGVPEERIVELDWGAHRRIGELTVHCTPARHFSGRGLVRNTTQWASWAVTGPRHRAFFGGDTGYTGAFSRIGAQLGPFDLTILPIGAYADLWPDMHMNPEEAVLAHRDLTGDGAERAVLLPVHWATFDLGMHPWAEPVERLLRAADSAGITVTVPRPGTRTDLTHLPEGVDWWSVPAG